jgi:hypothetical protein
MVRDRRWWSGRVSVGGEVSEPVVGCWGDRERDGAGRWGKKKKIKEGMIE